MHLIPGQREVFHKEYRNVDTSSRVVRRSTMTVLTVSSLIDRLAVPMGLEEQSVPQGEQQRREIPLRRVALPLPTHMKTGLTPSFLHFSPPPLKGGPGP